MTLIEEGSACSTLYVLHRGALRIAAPLPKFDQGNKGGGAR